MSSRVSVAATAKLAGVTAPDVLMGFLDDGRRGVYIGCYSRSGDVNVGLAFLPPIDGRGVRLVTQAWAHAPPCPVTAGVRHRMGSARDGEATARMPAYRSQAG